MANRPSRLVVPVRAPSYDGRYWGRYPNGDKPATGAVLQADALGRVGAAGQLSTAIRLGGAASDVAGGSGGLSSGIKLAASAADVAAASAALNASTDSFGIATYALQSLATGINNGVGFTNDNGGGGNSAAWMTDGTGGFARLTYGSGGTAGLRWAIASLTHPQIYVRFDIRRNNTNTTKQLKLFGKGFFGGGNYSNATFGCMGGYSGYFPGVHYSDDVSGGDTSCEMNVGGYPTNNLPNIGYGTAFSRTPYPTMSQVSGTPASPTPQQRSDGNWERWEMFVKFNDDGIPNGETAMWQEGVLRFWLTNQYNCGTGLQAWSGLDLGGYANTSGFSEDYRLLNVSYDRPVGRGI